MNDEIEKEINETIKEHGYAMFNHGVEMAARFVELTFENNKDISKEEVVKQILKLKMLIQ